MLHPFLPFITEEIWSALMDALPAGDTRPKALIVAPYPESNTALIDEKAEAEVEAVIDVIRAVRNLRAEFRLPAGESVPATVEAPELGPAIEDEASAIVALARTEPLLFGPADGDSSNDRVSVVLPGGTVTIRLGGLVDLDRERERLNEELKELETSRVRLSARLKDDAFTSKAPEEVVERERQRLERAEERQVRVREILSRLGSA